jgi:glutathione synthase/RimK-type ligase-like ATP-grasp enzyme
MDITSNQLISWLRYYGVPHIRLNTDSRDALQLLTDWYIGTGTRADIGVVYLRKLAIPDIGLPAAAAGRSIVQSLTGEYYQAYLKPLISQAALPVNNYHTATQLNKYETLLAAQAHGLTIPETIITNTKNKLLDFLHGKGYTTVITTPADELCTFSSRDYIFKTFARQLTMAEIAALPDRFFPSLFQQAITNLLDIKTVYCFGQFFTAAYLQTGNTSTDFRSNYAHIKTLSYRLPDDVSYKLDKLLKQLGLSVCTVDFVLSEDGVLYFLEINPFGQFGAISAACNYHIEKRIAQKFIPYAG